MCNICEAEGTCQYVCEECDFDICGPCYEGAKEEKDFTTHHKHPINLEPDAARASHRLCDVCRVSCDVCPVYCCDSCSFDICHKCWDGSIRKGKLISGRPGLGFIVSHGGLCVPPGGDGVGEALLCLIVHGRASACGCTMLRRVFVVVCPLAPGDLSLPLPFLALALSLQTRPVCRLPLDCCGSTVSRPVTSLAVFSPTTTTRTGSRFRWNSRLLLMPLPLALRCELMVTMLKFHLTHTSPLPRFGVVVGSRFLSFLYVNYSTLCMEIFFFKEPLL